MPVTSLSVLLVEDSPLFRSALMNLLSRSKSFRVFSCSSRRLIKGMVLDNPCVTVIDAVTWASSSQALIQAVHQTSLLAPVILLGREDLLDRHFHALRSGAVGFVKQTASLRQLSKAIRTVAEGNVWYEKSLFRRIVTQIPKPQEGSQGNWFSLREQKIMSFVASGRTNKEIATNLGCTERTIKAYVSSLFRKTGVANRSALASYAIRNDFADFVGDSTT